MQEQHLTIVTDADYDAALARIAAGTHSDKDLNLVRAWQDRLDMERAEMIDAIRAQFEGIPLPMGKAAGAA
jgi:hypothetical protein